MKTLVKSKKLEAAVRQSEMLAAVGQLAAGIAHEIRNPLASISGSVQLLEGVSGADNERLMAIITREIDRLNGLISEFMDFVKPENIQKEPLGLKSLIDGVVEMVSLDKNLREGVEISVAIDDSLKILGDSGKLKQVFLNMLINSHHALVDVEAPKIEIHGKAVSGKIELSVRDNGCGMDPTTRDRVFEPFHTTKAKGTGLGMAVSHKIIEVHSAEIRVESEVGQGTKFVIHFPEYNAQGLADNS